MDVEAKPAAPATPKPKKKRIRRSVAEIEAYESDKRAKTFEHLAVVEKIAAEKPADALPAAIEIKQEEETEPIEVKRPDGEAARRAKIVQDITEDPVSAYKAIKGDLKRQMEEVDQTAPKKDKMSHDPPKPRPAAVRSVDLPKLLDAELKKTNPYYRYKIAALAGGAAAVVAYGYAPTLVVALSGAF